MVNASFEEPLIDGTPPGWRHGWRWDESESLKGKEQYLISEDVAMDGKYSMRADGSKVEGQFNILSEPLPAIPGFIYTVSVNAYAEAPLTPRPYIMLAFFDESGKRIDYESLTSTGAEGEWHHMSVTGAAPEGTVTVSLLLVGNSTYSGVIYWDDAKLEVSRP